MPTRSTDRSVDHPVHGGAGQGASRPGSRVPRGPGSRIPRGPGTRVPCAAACGRAAAARRRSPAVLRRLDFRAIFESSYLLHPSSDSGDLGLVGLRFSPRTSLWAQCGLNLEASNPNNLHLDSIFGLLQTPRASGSPRPHALGQSPADHGWANMGVEPGCSIPSPSYAVLLLT